MKCIYAERISLISDKLTSETLNSNTYESSAEKIIEGTEKSLLI